MSSQITGRAILSRLKRNVELVILLTKQLSDGPVSSRATCQNVYHGNQTYLLFATENVVALISHIRGLSGASDDELRAYAGLEDNFEDIC